MPASIVLHFDLVELTDVLDFDLVELSDFQGPRQSNLILRNRRSGARNAPFYRFRGTHYDLNQIGFWGNH
jgi:hypothetical protein